MSKSIDKDLKNIEYSIKGMFKDMDALALNIAAVNKTRADMEATGNYHPAYIEDVLEKEKKAIAQKMKAKGMPVEMIADMTGLAAEEIAML